MRVSICVCVSLSAPVLPQSHTHVTGIRLGSLKEASCQPVLPPPSPPPNQISVSHSSALSYAILLGPSASVDELVRQAAAVVTTAVAACDTDASGARTPALAASEAASPAQRAGWVMSLCGATHAKDSLQQLAAGLVLPAMALR